MTPAAAPPRTRARTAPPVPRRVSGPLRPAPVPAPTPRPRTRPAPAPSRTGVFDRIRALPDHRLVDALLTSQAWIWLIGIALGGIVAMQVSLLKLNAGISRAVETSATLERQNAELEAQVAQLASSDRIRAAAARAGMVMPDAGAIGYLTARGEFDARKAVSRMTGPAEDAIELMRAGGRVSADTLLAGATAPVTTVGQAPVTEPTGTAAPTAADPTAMDGTEPSAGGPPPGPPAGGAQSARPEQASAPQQQSASPPSPTGGAQPE